MKRIALVLCFTFCLTTLTLLSACSKLSPAFKSQGKSDATPRNNISQKIEITDPQTGETAKKYGPSISQMPKDARKFTDIEFVRTPQGPVFLDIYLPAKVDKPLPLIVWIHGGGWHVEKDSRLQFIPGRMVGRGYALASISYRDSRKAIFPAQIEDCKAAIRWLRANAAKYDINPDRIGVWGASAGGHLSALLGTSGGVKKLEGNGGNERYPSRVQAVCDFCGPTDVKNLHAPTGSPFTALVESLRKDFVGGDPEGKHELFALADPFTYVTPDDPAFLIMQGDADSLVRFDQSERLYNALKKKDVEVTFCVLKGANHIFWGPTIDKQVDAFFDKHLKGKSGARQ